MNWESIDGMPAQAYNSQFLQKLAQDPASIAAVGDSFVRDRLREDMVMNQIIPQTPVPPERLQRMFNSDTLVEVIDLDANAAASIADFRGAGRAQISRARRVGLGFHQLQSDNFEVVEQELLVYPFPIVKLVHDYSIKAIGDVHDLYMLQNAKRAVDFVDADAGYKAVFGGGSVLAIDPLTGLPVAAAAITTLTSTSIVRAKKNMSNRIAPEVMLMTQYDHSDLDALTITEQGETLRSEVFIAGYKQPTVTGLRKVVTTKQDVFRPGNVWLFTSPQFLGKNRVLDYGGNAYKLFIDRRLNIITWAVYTTVGAMIANVGSVTQLKLYGATYAGANPKLNPLNLTNDDLFQNRNLAADNPDLVAPVVRQF